MSCNIASKARGANQERRHKEGVKYRDEAIYGFQVERPSKVRVNRSVLHTTQFGLRDRRDAVTKWHEKLSCTCCL